MPDTRSHPVLQIFDALTRPRRRLASAEDLQALSGATRLAINHEGASLAVWSWGEGPSVLLLHGWESRASHMFDFVPELNRAGLRAIALDAPAHGESDGDVTDVVDYGRAVISAAAHFGPLAAVIAHSVGSAAALYAYAHGVRVQASVQLCGPASLTRVLRRGGAAGGLDASGIAQLEALMEAHLGASLEEMELSSLCAGMVHPALILHDPEDRELCVSESRTLAAAWPGSTFSLVSGLGHRRILRDPSVISSAVGFIANELVNDKRC
jgi:pimeloyl-ACP methyl ester carboxylesterase